MKKLIVCLAIPFLSGCSVIMAANSSEGPDASLFHEGTPRAQVERELGPSLSEDKQLRGTICTYQFYSGDKADYKRATAYAFAAGLTLGISELVTSPVETLRGNKHEVEITYDLNDRIKRVKEKVIKSPL